MKRSIVGILLVSSTLLTGCSLLPEPVALIQAPKQAKATSTTTDQLLQEIQLNLPQGSSLYVPDEPVGMDSIMEVDLENDGHHEVVAFYKSNIKPEKAGAVILKKNQELWKRIDVIEGNGYEINWGSVADLTGDGRPELLIGWKVGVSSGNILDVYSFENQKFKKISQLNYHELDLVYANNTNYIVTWIRDFADVFNIEIFKWKNDSLVVDKELYESYFYNVATYYQGRVEEAPDAPYYYYFLSDALLKAKQPESALNYLKKGMSLSITVPTFDEFTKLEDKIMTALSEKEDDDVLYYEPTANITINIPKTIADNITIEGQEGQNLEYIINVNVEDTKRKGLMFAIEVYSKDFKTKDEIPFPILTESEKYFYVIRRSSENPFINDPNLSKVFMKSTSFMEEMISSVQVGSPFINYRVQEDDLLINKVQEALMKSIYVGTGGAMEGETVESFDLNNLNYRFLGSDLNSMEKLTNYLSSSYSNEAIQSFIESTGIIEHNGRLAQPNADGGSLLNYSNATIEKVKNLGTEMQFDLKVPIGNSLTFKIVPVVFKKTEDGWRITSNPINL